MNAARSAARKAKKYPSESRRMARKKKHHRYNDHYTTVRYGIAVARACEKAKVPHWHPNQLRHTFATRVRKQHGLEAAQILLGHARADVTLIYAERDEALAVAVAAELG
jgi:integrase